MADDWDYEFDVRQPYPIVATGHGQSYELARLIRLAKKGASLYKLMQPYMNRSNWNYARDTVRDLYQRYAGYKRRASDSGPTTTKRRKFDNFDNFYNSNYSSRVYRRSRRMAYRRYKRRYGRRYGRKRYSSYVRITPGRPIVPDNAVFKLRGLYETVARDNVELPGNIASRANTLGVQTIANDFRVPFPYTQLPGFNGATWPTSHPSWAFTATAGLQAANWDQIRPFWSYYRVSAIKYDIVVDWSYGHHNIDGGGSQRVYPQQVVTLTGSWNKNLHFDKVNHHDPRAQSRNIDRSQHTYFKQYKIGSPKAETDGGPGYARFKGFISIRAGVDKDEWAQPPIVDTSEAALNKFWLDATDEPTSASHVITPFYLTVTKSMLPIGRATDANPAGGFTQNTCPYLWELPYKPDVRMTIDYYVEARNSKSIDPFAVISENTTAHGLMAGAPTHGT